MSADDARMSSQNDDLRRYLYDGCVIMTPGVAALGAEAMGQIANAIATFDDFYNATAPNRKQGSGEFDFGGKLIVFKIDHYPKDLSPDPSDPNPTGTERIITIRLAEEY